MTRTKRETVLVSLVVMTFGVVMGVARPCAAGRLADLVESHEGVAGEPAAADDPSATYHAENLALKRLMNQLLLQNSRLRSEVARLSQQHGEGDVDRDAENHGKDDDEDGGEDDDAGDGLGWSELSEDLAEAGASATNLAKEAWDHFVGSLEFESEPGSAEKEGARARLQALQEELQERLEELTKDFETVRAGISAEIEKQGEWLKRQQEQWSQHHRHLRELQQKLRQDAMRRAEQYRRMERERGLARPEKRREEADSRHDLAPPDEPSRERNDEARIRVYEERIRALEERLERIEKGAAAR